MPIYGRSVTPIHSVPSEEDEAEQQLEDVMIWRLLYVKEMTLQGKGWLDFNSLSLTNGSARADMEDNVSRARTSGPKG